MSNNDGGPAFPSHALDVDLRDPDRRAADARRLHVAYGLRSTQFIVTKMQAWAAEHNRKLMVLLSYDTPAVLDIVTKGERFDGQFLDFLNESGVSYVDCLAKAAEELGCRSVAYTYNDPVIFMEYAVDTAKACRERDIKSVAVTAGYVCDEPRREFYGHMDAANVDLKAFSEDFYWELSKGHLQPVLDTLLYLKRETGVWFETTTLLIPGKNDSEDELDRMTSWVVEELGPDVPMHFTAFHPDWKMLDIESTPAETLSRARRIAMDNGVHFAYTGNVHDSSGGSTYCPGCDELVIERDWYELGAWNLNKNGACQNCGTKIPGHFDATPGNFGAKRMPVRLAM